MFLLHLENIASHRMFSVDRCKIPCFGSKVNEIIFVDRDDIEFAKAYIDTAMSDQCLYVEIIVPGYSQAFQWIDEEYQIPYRDYLISKNLKNTAFGDIEFQSVSDETILEYLRDVGDGYYDNLPLPN